MGPVSNYIFNNIAANDTIAATFTPVTYTITATAGSGGSISPSGIITVEYDSSQTYTITPNNGYRIEDLKVDNISVGPLSNYIFNNITAISYLQLQLHFQLFSILTQYLQLQVPEDLLIRQELYPVHSVFKPDLLYNSQQRLSY